MSYTVKLPDGKSKNFTSQPSGLDLAKSLGPGLHKDAMGVEIKGRGICDIRSLLEDGDEVKILTKKSFESLEIVRHSAAHVLAQAVQNLWPDVKVTIGPVIDEGFYYDFDTERKFSPENLEKIEQEMKTLLKKKYEVTKEIWPVKKALKYFGEKGETLKQEIIRDLKELEVSIYKQGPWLDLCRGPHVQNLSQIGAVKVLSLSGAYWRGDAKNKQLQRIYGTAFHREKDLQDFLQKRKEAEQNDHRVIGKKLDLFWFSPLSPGAPFFTASGAFVYHRLQDFLREKYRDQGYEEVITPQVFSGELFTRSGHAKHFSENMYSVSEKSAGAELGLELLKSAVLKTLAQHDGIGPQQVSEETGLPQKADDNREGQHDRLAQWLLDNLQAEGKTDKKERGQWKITNAADSQFFDKELFMKPMNCPAHCLLYKKDRRSYRDLPWRVADFGRLHRRESGGALHGLTRVKSFCQDDAHIFCRPDQLSKEIQKGIKMLEEIYQTLGLNDYEVSFSTRPEDRMGSDTLWDQAEEALRSALKALNVPFKEEPGEGAFYGPKLDISVRDSFSRSWQLGTFQCDFNLPEAFNLEYINSKDCHERPVIVHRAVLGSLERFIGVYLEHRRGRLPLWLCPVQAIVLPIGETDETFSKEIQKKLEQEGIICKIDTRNEKLSYKIRQAQLSQIPYMIVIGKKEAQTGLLSLRLRDGKALKLPFDSLKESLLREIKERALSPVFSPAVSKGVNH